MAPEVYKDTNYTEQCDIYSWAIVFWQLLSKEFSPYEGQDKNRYSKTLVEIHSDRFDFFHRFDDENCHGQSSSTEIKALSRSVCCFNVSFMAF